MGLTPVPSIGDETHTAGALSATIVLTVLASICTTILIAILVSNCRWARRITGCAKFNRSVSRLSELSLTSLGVRIPMTISEPIPQHRGSLFWGDGRGLPAQPRGEDISSEPAPSTRVPLMQRLFALVKAFSMRRSKYNTYPGPSPPTDRSFILPTVRTLAAPKKAFVLDQAWKAPPANAGDNQ